MDEVSVYNRDLDLEARVDFDYANNATILQEMGFNSTPLAKGVREVLGD